MTDAEGRMTKGEARPAPAMGRRTDAPPGRLTLSHPAPIL